MIERGKMFMKDDAVINGRVCPLCQKIYYEPSALSRTDNKTEICTDCSTRQALVTLGINEEEQNAILEIIHRYRNNAKY